MGHKKKKYKNWYTKIYRLRQLKFILEIKFILNPQLTFIYIFLIFTIDFSSERINISSIMIL